MRNLFSLLLVLSTSATAAGGLHVDNVWTRATAPKQPAAGVYMDLAAAAPVSLIGGASPAAERVELHTMAMDKGVMVMRRVDEIPVRPGQPVQLKPGGLHVMLIGLKSPLKAGERVPLTLQVRQADGRVDELVLQAEVRDASGKAGGGAPAGSMHHHH
jgi:copper(I)-binding protein